MGGQHALPTETDPLTGHGTEAPEPEGRAGTQASTGSPSSLVPGASDLSSLGSVSPPPSGHCSSACLPRELSRAPRPWRLTQVVQVAHPPEQRPPRSPSPPPRPPRLLRVGTPSSAPPSPPTLHRAGTRAASLQSVPYWIPESTGPGIVFPAFFPDALGPGRSSTCADGRPLANARCSLLPSPVFLEEPLPPLPWRLLLHLGLRAVTSKLRPHPPLCWLLPQGPVGTHETPDLT